MGDNRAEAGQPVSDTGGGVPLVTTAANAQTVYADAVWFVSYYGGVVRLTFLENMLEPNGSLTPGMQARHVGTLVMPLDGFDGMVTYLAERRDAFRGVIQATSDAG